MGEESNLEKRLIFSGMVSAPAFEPNIVAQPLPGVTLYDGLNLNEFDPEIIFEHNDFECTVEPKDIKAFRKILGLPGDPIAKVKRRRKAFKKMLMAYGESRNEAEEICKITGSCKGRMAYSSLCEDIFHGLGR